MLGLVLSLVVSAAAAMPSAGVTCPDGPETCDGASVPVAAAPGQAADDDGPRDYATPAEVDCPTPGDGPVAAGECDAAPVDLWYRVSRSPDSERPAGSLAPAPRRPRAGHASSCGGRPADPGNLSAPDVQPLAIFALPGFEPVGAQGSVLAQAEALPLRTLAPPDRPPRA